MKYLTRDEAGRVMTMMMMTMMK